MSKIIGNTVGMGLPKPDLRQTDPTKGDYVKGKEEFFGIINLYVCSDGEYTADGSPMIPKPDKDTTYLVPQDNEGTRYVSWIHADGAWQFVEELIVTLDETDEVPDDNHINELINAALGPVEAALAAI